MDHVQGFDLDLGQRHDSPNSQIVVSSRRRTLERLVAVIRERIPRPVLLTGEPGAGKTWLTHRLKDNLNANWHIIHVDLAAAMDGLDFLGLIADSLGATMPDRLGAARLCLQSILRDEAADGRSWVLVVDEADRGSAEVWDEIRAFRNRLTQPAGFAALIVVGRTELARTINDRRLTPSDFSLHTKLHLMPLDLDEARELMSMGPTGVRMDEHALETLHRDARGNPSVLLRLLDNRPRNPRVNTVPGTNQDRRSLPADVSAVSSSSVTVERPAHPRLAVGAPTPTPERGGDARIGPPSLVPTRPPIRVEEGLVEVGWEGDLESELDHAGAAATEPVGAIVDDSAFNEELVEDRYAALQAWTEWTRNKGRHAVDGDSGASGRLEPGIDADELEADRATIEAGSMMAIVPDPSIAPDVTGATAPANVRAEPQHDHAPYSQLFTRLRQSR